MEFYVQSQMKTNTGISPLVRKDGQMVVSDAEKADVLNTFFSSVFTRENTTNVPHIEVGEKSGGITQTDIRVTPKVAQDKLNQLDPNKAEGPDQVPPRVLKKLSE